MKGFLKGCIITALVCSLAGIVILTASVSVLGWRGIWNLVEQGELTVAAYNDWGWERWNSRLDLEDARAELEDAKQEAAELKREFQEEFRNEFQDGFLEEMNDLRTELDEELQEELEDAIADINDSLQESMETGLDMIEDGAAEYRRAGGDSIGRVVASRADIRNLEIDFGGGALHLFRSPDNQVRVASTGGQVEFSCYVENGRLVLKDKKSSRLSAYNNRRVYLSIPEGLFLERAEINIGGGLLTVERIEADELFVSVGAGQAVLDKMYADRVQMDIGAGEILVNRGVVQDMEMDIGAGHGAYAGTITGDADVGCGIGMAELVLTGSSADHNYEVDVAAGSILLDGRSYSGLGFSQSIENGADSDFTLTSSMGMLTVEFTR